MSLRVVTAKIVCLLAILAALGVLLHHEYASRREYLPGTVLVVPQWANFGFGLYGLDMLTNAHPEHTLVMLSERSVQVASASQAREISATAIRTHAEYFDLRNMEFSCGGPWLYLYTNAAVINESLAWRLFGGVYDIEGISIWIDGRPYIIVGVARAAPRADDAPVVWLAHPPLQSIMGISTLYVRAHEPYPLTVSVVQNALEAQHLHPTFFDFVEIDRLAESIGMRTRLLTLVLWAIVAMKLSAAIFARRQLLKQTRVSAASVAVLGALALAWVGIAAYILHDINTILAWLPNLTNPDASVVGAIFGRDMPAALSDGASELLRYSSNANIAFAAGMLGIVGWLLLPRINPYTQKEEL